MEKRTQQKIFALIFEKIDNKLANYTSETEYKPFFEAIFSKEIITLASVMQSLYTSFGMSIYEQIAEILAREAGYEVHRQYDLVGQIDTKTESLITDICNNLLLKPDKNAAVENIRDSIMPGKPLHDSESRVDVFFINGKGEEFYIDITTVKPNIKEFKALRRKMLRWSALRFSQYKNAKVKTYIGIPYNPYFPQPYPRWDAHYDAKGDLLVQNDLWKTFAGYDVFDELLVIFAEAGKHMKENVSKFLASHKK